MAVQIRRATLANPSTGVQHRLYTVPTGKVAILRTLFQGYNNTPINQEMGITVNGAGFFWQQTVPTWESKIWPLSTVLTAGQYVNAQHSELGMYTMLQYAEMDAQEGANLWQHHFIGVAANTWTEVAVPAGKRVRVREVVVCNHADTSDWSVYISSLGHFVKLHAKPRVGNVFGVDMTANAGEMIGTYTPAGPSGHVFLSGVIEDA